MIRILTIDNKMVGYILTISNCSQNNETLSIKYINNINIVNNQIYNIYNRIYKIDN